MSLDETIRLLRDAIETNTAGAMVDAKSADTFLSLLRFIYTRDLVFVRTPEQAQILWNFLRGDPQMFLMFNDVVNSFTLMISLSPAVDGLEPMGTFMVRMRETLQKLGVDAKSEVLDEQFTHTLAPSKMEWVDEHPWFNVLVAWRYLIPAQNFKVVTGGAPLTGKPA